MHFGNVGVDQWFQPVSLSVNRKFPLSAQRRRWQQHIFHKGQEAVFLNHLGSSDSLVDFLGDGLGCIEQINLASCDAKLRTGHLGKGLVSHGKWFNTLIAGAHLSSVKPRDHGVENVRALELVSLCERRRVSDANRNMGLPLCIQA